MICKVVSVFLIILLIMFGSIVALKIYTKPVMLEAGYLKSENTSRIDYGKVPVFAENLRFNHNLISYSIEDDCDYSRKRNMYAAFNIFSDAVKVVSFYEIKEGGDIKVGCSNEFIELEGNLFAAGEGGPSRIINTSGFKVIEEGKIILYNGLHCEYPIVALHELSHVFGFDHSPDPKNIMYNTSSCDQRMSLDMVDLMQELYSIEPLADARIDDVSGILHGSYLDFNISVLNEGLQRIYDVDLLILVDDEVLDSIDLGEIEIGYGRTLKVKNMDIGLGVEEIEFVVDSEDKVRELDEGNNVAVLLIS